MELLQSCTKPSIRYIIKEVTKHQQYIKEIRTEHTVLIDIKTIWNINPILLDNKWDQYNKTSSENKYGSIKQIVLTILHYFYNKNITSKMAESHQYEIITNSLPDLEIPIKAEKPLS